MLVKAYLNNLDAVTFLSPNLFSNQMRDMVSQSPLWEPRRSLSLSKSQQARIQSHMNIFWLGIANSFSSQQFHRQIKNNPGKLIERCADCDKHWRAAWSPFTWYFSMKLISISGSWIRKAGLSTLLEGAAFPRGVCHPIDWFEKPIQLGMREFRLSCPTCSWAWEHPFPETEKAHRIPEFDTHLSLEPQQRRGLHFARQKLTEVAVKDYALYEMGGRSYDAYRSDDGLMSEASKDSFSLQDL